VKTHFTDAAAEQLDGIYSCIAKDSVHYAKRVVERILQRLDLTATMPQAASIVPEYSQPDIREVFVYRYRVIYRILPDRIDLLAIVHGAKPLPESLEER
jgi:toxin ParE1/3/4